MFDQFSYRATNIYDNEQCQFIINKYNQDATHRANQGTNADEDDNRDVYIKRIDLANHLDIADKLFEANEYFYNFDISRKIECYFARYETNNHYNAEHTDCILLDNETDLQRKMSFSLLLNDNYEDGNLCITGINVEKSTGTLIVFPSFIPHKVSTVTSGTRYVIFGFCLGPIWR
jgi:predicted 2-oxoglutarate/Fe(II)-dependent dioxygenase YbiX